jgi:hypothetical protein
MLALAKEVEPMNEKAVRVAVVGVDLLEAVSAVPALLLGVVVGGSALLAAVITAFASRPLDALASAMAGCITVGWLAIEIAMIGLGSWAQLVWMLVGLLMIGLAVLLWEAEARAAAVPAKHGNVASNVSVSS